MTPDNETIVAHRQMRDTDLHYIVRRIPPDLMKTMRAQPTLMIGGGFCRAIIGGEEINDIDLFCNDVDRLSSLMRELHGARIRGGERARLHSTANALTLITEGRMTVQAIRRWVFSSPEACLASFDFTVCQAVVWFARGKWHGIVSEDFYPDLAARRLVYTSPRRDEDAGGSIMRVLKYVKRGYNIQTKSLGAVIARLTKGINPERLRNDESIPTVLAGLLREVDPTYMIDGLDIIGEHDDDTN